MNDATWTVLLAELTAESTEVTIYTYDRLKSGGAGWQTHNCRAIRPDYTQEALKPKSGKFFVDVPIQVYQHDRCGGELTHASDCTDNGNIIRRRPAAVDPIYFDVFPLVEVATAKVNGTPDFDSRVNTLTVDTTSVNWLSATRRGRVVRVFDLSGVMVFEGVSRRARQARPSDCGHTGRGYRHSAAVRPNDSR
ncbi:MAG: hypothetical protein IPK52_27625 [Chloroflexi bacterium]|nr:hypothetical protein [Chloroflexota bacterium]